MNTAPEKGWDSILPQDHGFIKTGQTGGPRRQVSDGSGDDLVDHRFDGAAVADYIQLGAVAYGRKFYRYAAEHVIPEHPYHDAEHEKVADDTRAQPVRFATL